MKVSEVVIRLMLAAIVGGVIGYEREFKNRPAGFRTHILVCLGAAVTSMIQLYSIQETINLILRNPGLESALKADIGRLGAQVITGVGFLGAGTIMHEKGSVKGLTTAASIWSVACIGLAAGFGYYTLTILATLCVFMVLVTLKKFETRFIDKTRIVKLQVHHSDKGDSVHKLAQYFISREIKIKNIEFSLEEEGGEREFTSTLYTLVVPRSIEGGHLITELNNNGNVIKAKIV
jgi:putative Mg2+ transporter-C (MgtC) family protein